MMIVIITVVPVLGTISGVGPSVDLVGNQLLIIAERAIAAVFSKCLYQSFFLEALHFT